MKQTFAAKVRKIDGGMRVEAKAREFTIIMDEPPSLGGTDTGMTPVEAVLAALGACQTIVAYAFAATQGIELKGFHVEVEGDLDTDGFLGLNPEIRNGFSEIRYTMHFETDASQTRVQHFADFIEAHCPVGDIIENVVPLIRAGIVIHPVNSVSDGSPIASADVPNQP
ncbi:MAG: OsmC family protein [Promicromonosporaceae bacterium]|nr:OsmC family protein [Promicromonosporaceae bacterium]